MQSLIESVSSFRVSMASLCVLFYILGAVVQISNGQGDSLPCINRGGYCWDIDARCCSGRIVDYNENPRLCEDPNKFCCLPIQGGKSQASESGGGGSQGGDSEGGGRQGDSEGGGSQLGESSGKGNQGEESGDGEDIDHAIHFPLYRRNLDRTIRGEEKRSPPAAFATCSKKHQRILEMAENTYDLDGSCSLPSSVMAQVTTGATIGRPRIQKGSFCPGVALTCLKPRVLNLIKCFHHTCGPDPKLTIFNLLDDTLIGAKRQFCAGKCITIRLPEACSDEATINKLKQMCLDAGGVVTHEAGDLLSCCE